MAMGCEITHIFHISGANIAIRLKFHNKSYKFYAVCHLNKINRVPMARNLHFRKMPDFIIRKSGDIKSPYQVVATTLMLKEEQILQGEYAHLGIIVTDEIVNYKSKLSPAELKGRFAKKNQSGYDIVHRDREKIRKYYSWDVPNFGDPDKGYHEISITRLVYPRTHIAPREWSISVELLKEEIIEGHKVYSFKISVDVVLCRANTTREEFLLTRQVGWEIFPAGSLERIVAHTKSNVGELTQLVETKIRHRYEFLASLNPKNFIVGSGMNRRYFGAQFSDNLVVF